MTIPREDKILTHNCVVCELHFTEDCIVMFYETLLPNGTIIKTENGKSNLKTGSTPTLFPNLSSYSTTNIKKRQSSAENKMVFQKPINQEDHNENTINFYIELKE